MKYFLQGNTLGYYLNKTIDECQLTCQSNDGCLWYSFSKQQRLCIIFESCPLLNENASDFVTNQVQCYIPNPVCKTFIFKYW